MKIDRIKNASRNMAFGGLMKLYQIVVPFLMRTAMIYLMGEQYLGLNSLFVSILQVLNIAESGVGSAMVYSMYKPIAEDDKSTICALLRQYRKYYYIIGFIIAAVGITLTPFIPKLVKSDLPGGLNIYILYLLNLVVTVLSYWVFAYKGSLLQAHQRVDIISKITISVSTIQYSVQIFVLVFLKNYYMYVIAALVMQILTNIATAFAADYMYPNYKPVGKLSEKEILDINCRIRDLFTSKMGGIVVNSVDTIVVSSFLGLSMLAVYQNYFFILSSVIGFVMIVFTACTAGIGNSIIVETKEKNYNDLKNFTFIITWISGFCTVCLLCLYQPFMDVWVGERLKLEYSAVICFCIYYFIYEINLLLNTYKDAAGIWHEDRFRPLITAFMNLVMNLVMVQFWGIYGVILSTVLSMLFVGMPWLLYNLFTVLFDIRDLPPYLKRLGFYVVVTSFTCFVTVVVCSFIHMKGWHLLIARGLVCCVLPNLLYLVFYWKLPEFRQSLQLADAMLKKGKANDRD
ncbi:polysaccharide biosynthesis protein [Lachnospiraceae bacterium 48-21]